LRKEEGKEKAYSTSKGREVAKQASLQFKEKQRDITPGSGLCVPRKSERSTEIIRTHFVRLVSRKVRFRESRSSRTTSRQQIKNKRTTKRTPAPRPNPADSIQAISKTAISKAKNRRYYPNFPGKDAAGSETKGKTRPKERAHPTS